MRAECCRLRSSVVCHGRIHGANGRGSVIGHSCSCSPGPACSVLCLVGDSSVLFMLVHSSCDTDRSCSTACRARASAQAGLSPTSLGSAQRANVQRRWTNERRRTVPRTRRTRTMGSGPDRRCQARSQAISIHFCIFERSVTQLTASRSATPCATPHPQPQDYRSGSAPGCSTRTRTRHATHGSRRVSHGPTRRTYVWTRPDLNEQSATKGD